MPESLLNRKQRELILLLQDLWERREKRFALELKRYEEQVHARDNRISELLKSMSWRITSPIRSLHRMIFSPEDTAGQTVPPVVPSDPLPPVDELCSALFKIHANEMKDYFHGSLGTFLHSFDRIALPCSDSPEISVIGVLYNRADLTHFCLRSLAASRLESAEVILVDNASSDLTEKLLKRVDGVRVIRNEENRHFLLAANQAAQQAKGEVLLFLNNDTEVMPGSIIHALNTLKSSGNIGAVGGKLIFPHGMLQEAGSIIWNDGSCVAYGRGDTPSLPQYMFRRDVDYCSAAFLLTRRRLFLELGGFDESYQPAYYEDSDYCLKLWKRGLRVVYEPQAVVLHHEFGSSASQEQGLELQSRNRSLFLQKHHEWLSKQQEPKQKNMLLARDRGGFRRRVLLIDDRVPHPCLGAGYPRANTLVRGLIHHGCFVTHYPLIVPAEPWDGVYRDFPPEVEVMISCGESNLESFLTERRGYYDAMLVSRPLNMAVVDPLIEKRPELFAGIDIIYDAEAIFSFRELRRRKLRGVPDSKEQEKELVATEIKLARFAKTVICVSEEECSHFKQAGIPNVALLAHSVPVQPTSRSFDQRNGFLFVGFVFDDESPNGDSLLWFLEEIFPRIQERLGPHVNFTFAGLNNSPRLAGIKRAGVIQAGVVPDLTQPYNQARVFVAPTRFAAGLPMKIHEASSRGLPVVGTSLMAAQLGWTGERDMLVADDARGFADQCIRLYTDPLLWSRIRENALERVRRECSPETFLTKLKTILDEL
jgi:GT2 family glycosyltransferase